MKMLEFKTCRQDISKTIKARDLKLGQLIEDAALIILINS